MLHKFFATVGIAALMWLGGFLWFLSLIPAQETQETRKADAIIVLTGGALRLERGFELLAQNAAPKLFISGVEDSVTLNELLHAKEYRHLTENASANNVILGYKARTTTGNALEVAEWVKKENVKTILLVTGNYHLPRSIYQIKHLSPSLSLMAEPVFPGHFSSYQWWYYPDSRKLMISEYHKYVYVLFEALGL